MPPFNYIAIDRRGAEQSGILDAVDSKHAVQTLRAQGLFATQLTLSQSKQTRGEWASIQSGAFTSSPLSASSASKSGRGLRRQFSIPFTRVVDARALAGFTRQLATLLQAGMPLVRGLEVLARQERNAAFRSVITQLAGSIKSGDTFSDALANHEKIFDRLYVNMVKAGEASGSISVVLERLARFQEKSLQLRNKVRAAMVYPIIVMGVAVVILAGLLVFVVPRFKQIFADLLKGAPLPALTQIVLTISEIVRHHFLLVLAGALVLGIAFKVASKTTRGKRWLDALVLRVPVVGSLLLKNIIARFGRTLGTLLSSGVPILPALLITRDTGNNATVAHAITEVHERVKAGASVAHPLEITQVFPPMVTSMVDVGEHTGQLPEMLNKVADIYEDEVDTAVAGLSSMLEPVLILFLAGVVGTIVVALFLPIIRIVQLLT